MDLRHLLRPLDKARFAAHLCQDVQRARPEMKYSLDAEQFSLTFEGGRILNLATLYEEYLRCGPFLRHRVFARVVQHAVRELDEPPKSFIHARTRLLPALRDPLTFDLTAREQQEPKYEPPFVPVGDDDYGVFLAYDTPTNMAFLNAERFAEWEVPFERALEYARENLAKLPFRMIQEQPGFFVFDTQDSYDSSRLVLLDMIRELGVRGAPVVGVPHRDRLLVTGDQDEGGLALLAERIEGESAHPRVLGQCPLRLEGDTWKRYRPTDASQGARRIRLLIQRDRASRYGEQRQRLERVFERDKRDVYVASFELMSRTKEAEPESWCVWSAGVPSMLPRTDLVALAAQRKAVGFYPWERLKEVAGSLMEPVGTKPERWEVSQFPSEEMLRELEPVREMLGVVA